jgi:hypothetical protein
VTRGVTFRLYTWRLRKRLPERNGALCHVLVRSVMNSQLVQFVDDGHRVVTTRNATRKAQP